MSTYSGSEWTCRLCGLVSFCLYLGRGGKGVMWVWCRKAPFCSACCWLYCGNGALKSDFLLITSLWQIVLWFFSPAMLLEGLHWEITISFIEERFITGACVLSMYEIGKLLVTQIPSQSLLCEDICTVTVNSLHWVSGKAASHCPKQLAIKDGHRNVSTSHRGAYFLSGLLWVLFLTTFKLGESCWEIRPFASSAVWKETVLFLLCICCNVLHFLSKQGGWVLYILICERIIFGSSLQHIHEVMWHHFQRHIFFPPLNSEWISFSILIWKQGVKRHVWAKPHNGSDVYLAMHLHFRSRIDPLAAVAVTDQELPNFL